ncbi:hypothetical protein BDW74DRAFT_18632 [Aspergillus multicolor]|uniref:uncharacterized protein n=1 Tax=Aspergillus multicolor TaxID=41759 RepID=UPI003CCDD057
MDPDDDDMSKMWLPEPPIWIRSILLVLTVASYAPQTRRFHRKKTTDRVSSRYILWNLIRATEPVGIFAFGLYLIPKLDDGVIFLHFPPSAGDHFTLWHCVVVAFMSLILFMQVVIYTKTWGKRIKLVLSYIIFLLVSIAPPIYQAICPLDVENNRDQDILLMLYYAPHSMLIYFILAGLSVLGIFIQARGALAAPLPNALSLQGLAAQAVVYALLTVSWMFSLTFSIPWTFYFWFMVNRWIIFDSLVFSLGQALLLGLALRRRRAGKAAGEVSPEFGGDREREPLLGRADAE